MTSSRRFAQVDVFTSAPYYGNSVAVVLDGDGLTDEAMRQFAVWTNLSETTFVVPPTSSDADYGLRIFTPGGEIPFAGHPTLGSAHAWLESGGQPKSDNTVIQECGLGLITLRRNGDQLSFKAPDLLRSGPLEVDVLARIAKGLGVELSDVVDHQWVDNGPGWAAVRLASAEEVLALDPDPVLMSEFKVGVVGTYAKGSANDVEVRAFVGPLGIREDPVTGSLNAGLGQWLIGAGVLPSSYTASQGARVGRRGVVKVDSIDGEVWVGGTTASGVTGHVQL